jgi:uncharacterized protein (DUF58 family)
MFNETWIALTLFITLLALVMGQGGLLLIAVLILTIVPLAWLWNEYSLHGVEYERLFSEQRAFLCETVELTIRVANRKLLPLGWLRVDDQFPLVLPLTSGKWTPSSQPTVGYLSNLLSLRWYERVSRPYQVYCQQRGFYAFGPASMHSGDIFGLFSKEHRSDHLDWLIVYPKVESIESLGLPAKDPFGETKARQRIFEDPSRTIGVRHHQPEDGFKHIHWKATARHQELQVKVYEPTTTFNLIVFLNVATLPKHWQGTIPPLLERAISVAASIASYGVEQRYTVGLLANGCLPMSDQPIKVLPSRSPNQLTRILEALAAVTSFATSSIEDLLAAESPKLSWGATLVVVSAVITDELLSTMLRLRDAGRRLVLVSLADEAPSHELTGISTYHLPGEKLDFKPYEGAEADPFRADSVEERVRV